MKKVLLNIVLGFLLVGLATKHSFAHELNQSYVYLQIYETSISGRFEIAVSDLNKILNTEFTNDITIEDIDPYKAIIIQYYNDRAEFSSIQGLHEIEFGKLDILKLGGSLPSFVLLSFNLKGISEVPDELDVRYNALFDLIDNHRGLLIVEYNWKAGVFKNESIPSLFFNASDTKETLNILEGSKLKGFIGLIREGIWHIWIGLDHILFLFALILPSVIIRNRNVKGPSSLAPGDVFSTLLYDPVPSVWTPAQNFRQAFIYILKIVTFFTISHSITLALAALDVVVLPPRLVESVIAISIALAALNNLTPIFRTHEWIIAFIFGLFHGFGFANVLGEMRTGEYLVLTLLGFNIGVEIGQIAIIIIIFPILYLIRKTRLYNYLFLFGSIFLIFISLYWFVERSFEYDLKLGDFVWGILDWIGFDTPISN